MAEQQNNKTNNQTQTPQQGRSPQQGRNQQHRGRGGQGVGQFRKGRRGQNRKQNAPPSEYDQKILDIARVARVTAGGRRFNFRVTIVVGNRKGKVGVATGRGKDVAIAVDKATRNAQKNVFFIPITPEGSIPYATQGKKGSAQVIMMPAKSGRGIVAGGPVRIICDLAGYKDLNAKIIGRTTNKLTNSLATINALKKIKYVAPTVVAKKKTDAKQSEKQVSEKKEPAKTVEQEKTEKKAPSKNKDKT